MMDIKYYEILARNKDLGLALKGEKVPVKLLSNIMVHQLKEILEYQLRSRQIPVEVELGNYDNILQDAAGVSNEKVLIFWELANLVDQLPYKIEGFNQEEYEALENKVKDELSLLFNTLERASLVFFNLFSSLPFSTAFIRETKLDRLAGALNAFVRANAPKNFQLVNLDKIYCSLGLEPALDVRNFFTSKVLYKPDFFRQYVLHLEPALAATMGRLKKALILDCDNTLWGGILGEDGFGELKMSAREHAGVPYEAIQHLALQLQQEGVLLGLCSKNNPGDVDEVLMRHPDMLLKDEQIVVKKVNWQNKATNLQEIARELNIGLDSLVFVDDSDFEVNLIREQLPEVSVYQVPKKSYQYPALFQKIAASFFNPFSTEEDRKKSQIYKEQKQRVETQAQFTNMEDYLKSLEIKLRFYVDDLSLLARMAQMCQKTNQFNLTTSRYTESDLRHFVESKDYRVVAMEVADKFGDNGITGLAIVKSRGETAVVDSFLMSCRVIGRNIEWKFLDFVIGLIEKEKVSGRYIATARNKMVENFYPEAGFQVRNEKEGAKEFEIRTALYQEHLNLSYIQILRS